MSTAKVFKIPESLKFCGGKFCLNVLLPNSDNSETDIYFCVDKSGSMAGTAMSNVNTVLRDIYQKTKKDYTLLCYCDNIQERNLSTVTNQNLIRAEGGTIFSIVFEKILSIVLANQKPATFIFMTDGEDNSGAEYLKESMKKLRMATSAIKNRNITIHVIGFGNSIRDKFLNDEVRLLGNREGVFKYIKDSAELQCEFMDMFDYASAEKAFQMKIGDNNWQNITCTGNQINTAINYSVENGQKLILKDMAGKELEYLIEIVETPGPAEKLQMLNMADPETEQDVKTVLRNMFEIKLSSDSLDTKLMLEKMKMDIQQRMLGYIEIFNQIKMGNVREEVKLRLSALKHEAKFSNMENKRKLDSRQQKH